MQLSIKINSQNIYLVDSKNGVTELAAQVATISKGKYTFVCNDAERTAFEAGDYSNGVFNSIEQAATAAADTIMAQATEIEAAFEAGYIKKFLSLTINGRTMPEDSHKEFAANPIDWAERLYYTADINDKIQDLEGRKYYVLEVTLETVKVQPHGGWEFWGAAHLQDATLFMVTLSTLKKTARRFATKAEQDAEFDAYFERHGDGYSHSYANDDIYELPF